MLKVYHYTGCSTCKKAIQWLKQHEILFDPMPVRETPPSLQELKLMLEAHHGELRCLFNVSGQEYRALDLKTKLPGMTKSAALAMLHENGRLVKRPFAIDVVNQIFLVGFKEDEWRLALL